ncbi:MAG TPA: hypothetical protein VFW43_09365, partial [Polaromonas sp.]|nr:hypothetical protein [Polaromonas sp.]
LSLDAGDFAALQRRTWLAPAQLARDLASLHFAGSVTTTPEKAGTAVFSGGEDSLAGERQNGRAQAPRTAPASPRAVGGALPKWDLTAPAQLGRK